jgi:hypothetical protein
MKTKKIVNSVNLGKILTEEEKKELLGGNVSKLAQNEESLSSAKGSDGTYCSQSGLYCPQ